MTACRPNVRVLHRCCLRKTERGLLRHPLLCGQRSRGRSDSRQVRAGHGERDVQGEDLSLRDGPVHLLLQPRTEARRVRTDQYPCVSDELAHLPFFTPAIIWFSWLKESSLRAATVSGLMAGVGSDLVREGEEILEGIDPLVLLCQ